MTERIQAVVFDVAGTLLQLREPVGITYGRFALSQGVDLPHRRIEEAFQRILAATPVQAYPGEPYWRIEALERQWWWKLVRDTFRAADQMVHFADFDAYFGQLWQHYASRDAWELSPGVTEMLGALAQQQRSCAILSNFDHRLRPLLQAFDLHECFEQVVSPIDAGAAKPSQQIFDTCLKRLGLPGHRVAYVGHHPEQDMEGSRAAGLHPIDIRQWDSLAQIPIAIAELEEKLS